ncbi:UNVERIFIED_CONTAM: hypothetical protein PYX00_011464 [Menopon gallinae]|uniref:Phospholipid-transporting ATPase n=1 Tax=Menopon gallinae TaxID=328185 RepID=A0AAW2H7I7_9NEOP
MCKPLRLVLHNTTNEHPPNIIRNQRFSVLTFVPIVLCNQLKQVSNCFFLLIGSIQYLKIYNVTPPISSLFPWLIVMVLTLIKEGIDDFKRYKRDKEVNSEVYLKLVGEQFVPVPCSSLKPGDIVTVEKNQRIPADMAILKTNNLNGQVFIRTDQLDGETDWKLRVAVQLTQAVRFGEMANTVLEVEQPHKDIYTFFGSLLLSPACSEAVPLSLENTMWMNTVLATGQVIGMVMYTGKETRAMQNTSKPKIKHGIFETELNKYAIFLGTLSVAMSLFFTFKRGITLRMDIPFIRFMVIFSSVIPISLKTSVELARYLHAYMISKDLNVIVRNSNIPEELGRISYLLSDKTGTLTKNEMAMKKVHLGMAFYSEETFGDIRAELERSGSKGHAKKTSTSTRVFEFCEALSICHNVTPVEEGDGVFSEAGDLSSEAVHTHAGEDVEVDAQTRVNYQASSPDEVSIIRWCEAVGMRLHARSTDKIHVIDVHGNTNVYSILETFPFTSESKRMGIIVEKDNNIVFFLKGADVVMRNIVKSNDWLDEEVENMAREGLRTLVIAKKIMSRDEYRSFSTLLREARVSGDRERVCGAIESLEKNMTLLGITGVEDMLQDDVKITLESLRNAGIRIWMLTGDKIETATSIAISSRIFSRNSSILTIKQARTKRACECALAEMRRGGFDGVVIDGDSIDVMLGAFMDDFVALASSMKAFVGCRCSPTQKALLAKNLSRVSKKRVAAIGDGGNDVSMITESNIGFGIVGKEGKQASLAADFSLKRFKDVLPLLLWHGRRCYKSSARLAHLIIHRGTVLFIMQAIFCSMFLYAPISIYPGLLLMGYSTVYTFGPIFCTVLSSDITKENALKYPELYQELVQERTLGFHAFFVWFFFSFYQGSFIMLGDIYYFENELFSIIALSFTSLVVNEILMVSLVVHAFNRFILASIVFSIFMFSISLVVLPAGILVLPSDKTMFFVKVLAINCGAITISFLYTIWKKYLRPPSYSKL